MTVYGFEVEALAQGERLLIFGDGPLSFRLSEPDPVTLAVDLPRTRLDPSAPERLARAGELVQQVRAFERGDTPEPTVRLLIQRAAPGMPEVSRRGSILALEFRRAAAPAEHPGVTLQFDNQDIRQVVDAVARETGTPFLYDDQLRGRITISVTERVSPREALAILDSALLLKGFAAVPSPGGPRKIIRVSDLPAAAPWVGETRPGRGEAPVATLVRLRSADVGTVSDALKPLVGTSGLLLPYPATRSLILAGSEARLRRWLQLIFALDRAELADLMVRRLRYRPVGEVSELLRAAFGDPATARSPVELWPDERTNVLLVRASPRRLEEVREWIEELDVPVRGRGEIRTLPVVHADVERLAQTLQGATAAAPGDPLEALQAGPLAGRDYDVTVYAPTRTLVIRADPETHEVLEEVVRSLDRPPPRVSIEATVLELTTDASLSLGFDAFIPLTDPDDPGDTIAFVSATPSGALTNPALDQERAAVARFTRTPITFPIVGPGGEPLEVIVPRDTYVVTADGREIQARVLMRPHILAVAGEEHEIFAGNNIPIPTARTAEGTQTATTSLSLTQTVEREDVGVRLRVLPRVGEDEHVQVELELEETRLAPSLAGEVSQVGPTLERRQLSANLRLREGQVVVAGSLVRPKLELRETGTPFLRHLPILGALFRSTIETELRNQLVIAVQAYVQRSPEEDAVESVRRRVAFERSLARVEALLEDSASPYALWVSSFERSEEARRVAQELDARGLGPARVVAWRWQQGPLRFDVYTTGHATYAAAGRAALALVDAGWMPEVVPLPEKLR